MSNALDLVLIVDDSDDDNFITERVIKKSGFAKEIRRFNYAEDALQFLRSPGRSAADLILVDINMPRVDGFDFANAYATLYPELKSNAVLMIMSGSIDPLDRDRALKHPEISGFICKPVNIDELRVLYHDSRNNKVAN